MTNEIEGSNAFIPTTHDSRHDGGVTVLPPRAPAQVTIPTNPAEMLYLAMAQGKGMAELEKFMDLKDRWEASEAKKAYIAAMAGFKSEPIHVTKDKDNLQYKSKYASLGNLVQTVTPFLSKHGLSHAWNLDQSKAGVVRVGCTLTHEMGHKETEWFECAPDKSGAKNSIQEIKSAITYAKAVTFESVCGLAASDANLDDDGAGTSIPSEITIGCQQMEAAPTLESLHKVYVETIKKAGTSKILQGVVIGSKDKRKAEIQKGSSK